MRDNYLYGSAGDAGASRNYGVEAFGADAILVENNICQRRSPCYMADGDTGSVWGYNFSIYDHYTQSPTFLQGGDYTHETGNAMSLREGNVGTAYMMDNIHATSNLGTTFRNRWSGGASGKSANTIAIGAVTHNRYYNHIGNVLGTSGYHTAYQALQTYNDLAVWELGGASNNWPSDSVVAATTMRWGNYDTVNNAVRFVSGEVPSGIAKYPNPVPASQTLPASFYLNSKPAWFGAIPWPPIGPDVTGGNIANVGGHANKIPAQVCWETANAAAGQPADGSGKPVSFNADNCYTDASAGAPVAPTGLTVVVQ